MVRCCAVIDCSKKALDNVSLFSVPSPNKTNYEDWVNFLANANAGYMWVPLPGMVVCSTHFSTEMMQKHGQTVRLKPNACPLITLAAETLPETHKCTPNEEPITVVEEVELENQSDAEDILKTTIAEQELVKLKEQNESLQAKLNSSRRKRRNLKLICDRMKKSKLCPAEPPPKKPTTEQKRNMLLDEFISRQYRSRNAPYSDPIKDFAFQLHYYSPRGYEFFRRNIPVLPNSHTLNRWNDHVKGTPGFFPESMEFARKLQIESKHELLFALSFDEMYVRKQILPDGDGFIGYTDYGNVIPNEEAEKEAKTALFIMVSTINGQNKFPIGYFLTSGLKAGGLAGIITKALSLMHQVNCKVLTLTFDGLHTNLSAMKKLGADLDPLSNNFKPFIYHPDTNQKVYLILDVCHMMKLLRNLWKKFGVLFIEKEGSVKEIKWSYINELQSVQEKCGLKVANKLSSRHVSFENEKMKTRLCLQIFSNSVAVALGVCRQLGVQGFEGTESTQEFLGIIDRLFDTLNSKPNGRGMKSPLRPNNECIWSSIFSKSKSYLSSLKVYENGVLTSILKTKKCTAIKGLLVTIRSLEMLMTDVICSPNCELKYLPTFKLSQDMIETFFSIIRSRFGNNNNPNAKQLRWAVKAVLCMHADAIQTGNAIPQENVLTRVSSLGSMHAMINTTDEVLFEEEEPEEYGDNLLPTDLNLLLGNIVAYISGYVAKNLIKKLKCATCVCALMASNEDVPNISPDVVLIMERDNGGLFLPSLSLIETCKVAENMIRQMEAAGIRKMTKSECRARTVQACVDQNIFTGHVCNSVDGCNSDHIKELLGRICDLYNTARFHHIGRVTTAKLKPTSNRSKCTNLVQFKGN